MPININFVSSYADVYDLTDSKQAKKVRRIMNAKQRLKDGRSNGSQSRKVSMGYKSFDFLSK
jgi:hypothetical protein